MDEMIKGGERYPVLNLPSGHPRALHAMALKGMHSGEYQFVIDLLSAPGSDKDPLLLELLGHAFEAAGDLGMAVNIWEKTRNVEQLLSLGEIAVDAGDLKGAERAYFAAWNIDLIRGTSPLAGFLWKEKRDLAKTEFVFRQALLECSSCRYRPYWLRGLAELMVVQKRWAEAAETYNQVIEYSHLMYPGDQKIDLYYIEMAWAYYMDGHREKAFEAVEKSVVNLSADRQHLVLIRAGEIYERDGDIEKALDAYQKVLLTRPKDKTALEAITRLASERTGE